MGVEELEGWFVEFKRFHERFAPLFARAESRRHAEEYIRGLMAPLQRKNGWSLSESAGLGRPDALQRLLYNSTWSADAARDRLIEYVNDTFGAADAIVAVDETGFIKKGTKSVGVRRQYSGTAGKVDNCQIGVFAAYISGAAHTLVDRRLFLPAEWAEDSERCAEADVPEQHVAHRTKPQLAAEMIEHLKNAGLRFRWVVGDEVYGNATHLRHRIDALGKHYVLCVSATSLVYTEEPEVIEPDPQPEAGQSRRNGRPRRNYRLGANTPRRQSAVQLIANLPEGSWRRISVLPGEKGPRRYDWFGCHVWVFDKQHGATELRLLARRSLRDPQQIAYYLSNAPRSMPVATLARVAMHRWAIEQCFEEAKGELGLDHYEVRKWPSWHRHVTLTMMAHAWLAHMRASNQKIKTSESYTTGRVAG